MTGLICRDAGQLQHRICCGRQRSGITLPLVCQRRRAGGRDTQSHSLPRQGHQIGELLRKLGRRASDGENGDRELTGYDVVCVLAIVDSDGND